ncbi:hypothetical protein BpHYR1_001703 [Brachionus plicatilis]|uniref:Uncharacterized protein n=1 Tax=Brachionus plicatilis TaxID=10195 RepID=A0A3M7SZT5_BRAPC|nr:hypothetical protein BpHYR1_001703 [Brachionus plicatilis]
MANIIDFAINIIPKTIEECLPQQLSPIPCHRTTGVLQKLRLMKQKKRTKYKVQIIRRLSNEK